jgi:putative transposase
MSQSNKRGNKSARYPKEVELIVGDAIEKEYLCREQGTFQAVLDNALVAVIRENKLRPVADQLPMPTMRLVRRKIEEIPAFDRHAARHGRTAATKMFRAVQAHRTTGAPLERAEIDHTQLDLMVLDDKSGLPLGRPWLTVCVDDFTRCILGLYVGFEPPSHATVASCLKHAFLPKVKFAKKYPAILNEWDAHGVMRELVVDNGVEFHCISLENACFTLGIEIHYSARKTPWFKGKVERLIGTMNRAIAHGNPGTTFGNIFDKEEYDPSKHAIVRFSILLEVVNTWVADVYHQKVHRTLGAPPAAVWSKSIAPEDIMVPDDPAFLDAILGQSETRQLTHKGIELYGLLYNSYELTAFRRRHGTKLDVEVRVDPADLGKIVVLSADKREMFVAAALNAEYASGMSAWQHKVCKRFAASQMDAYDPSSWLEAKARIATLIDDELAHKKQSTRARIARYKGDAKLLAKGDAAVTKDAHAPTTTTPVILTPSTPPMTVAIESSDATTRVDASSTMSPPTAPIAVPAPQKRKYKPVYRSRVLTLDDAEVAQDD